MNDDFSTINLYFSERVKLFMLRFIKEAEAEYFGVSLKFFLDLKFIKSKYEFSDTLKNPDIKPTIYSLTDRYFRYCLYRRRKFFDSKIWPFVISIISAVATSVITAYITATITTQSILR
ncbi:MAG: hypothetical protein LIO86_14820 [Lachnospiraceae bacterium]|nr:hypothetical protein [Lachnospiraceae bacterium]